MFQVPTAAAAGWPPSPSCRRLLDGQPAPAATAAEQPPGPGCRQTTSHAALHELGWRRRRPPLTLGHGAPRLNQCLVNLSRFLAVNAQLRQHGHALCGLPVLSVPRGLLGHPCAVEAGRTAWRHVLCVQRLYMRGNAWLPRSRQRVSACVRHRQRRTWQFVVVRLQAAVEVHPVGLYDHQVGHLVQHAAYRRIVGLLHAVVPPAQAQRLHHAPMEPRLARHAAPQSDKQTANCLRLWHRASLPHRTTPLRQPLLLPY
mmetsp:Transcript_18234/g.54441  ORF Transcript_18234/g.54441 Transcript_18234/m.54441 type:complete len:257 (-) Transcript_18234:194-964(-)